jgi:transposase
LLVARRSVVAERTRVLNQLQALNTTGPVALRERVGEGTGKQLERRVLSIRAWASADTEERVAFGVMRDLAARSRALAADARRYERQLAELVRSLDRTLLDEPGVGPISAAKLLASDLTRFKHEAAFARCNGTAPLPASSGKTVRHRLNRGGDRQVNNAIHTIALIRAKHQPETRAYLDRRTSEGKTKREAMRALKRHIPRDLSKRLADGPLTS